MTAVNVVATPEEMPVEETIELVGRAREELDVALGAVIVNRVLPELFTHADEEAFDALREPRTAERAARPSARCAARPRCSTAARLAVSLRRTRAGHLDPAAREVDLPLLYVPYLFSRDPRPARDADGRRGAQPGARAVSSHQPATLEQLLATKEIVVCCGSGGVGKTTVAASAALGAASRLGGKVLVLTIDPAKRLADALGLEGIGNVEKQVPDEAFKAAGPRERAASSGPRCSTRSSRGTRSCCATRPTRRPRTGSSTTACTRTSPRASCRATTTSRWSGCSRSTRPGGSTSSSSTRRRPGTRSTSSTRPKRMAEFFGGRLLRWLTMPYRVGGKRGARMINVASRPFYQMADRLLGSQFLQDIAEFFLNFQSMYGGFVERANAVERLLHDRRTTFAVVTTLESAPLHEAEYFCDAARASASTTSAR